MPSEPLIHRDRHWTIDDLAELPDDGHRYEIIDGVLVMSGSPSIIHQRAVGRLAMVLDGACPAGYEVFVAPLGVVLAEDTVLQPDVLVARSKDLTADELPAAPMLAVEVLSPGSHMIDLNLKPQRLARAGTPAYWVVDPVRPRLTAWELAEDGRYVQVAEVTGDEAFDAVLPYPVRVQPSSLIAERN